MASVTEEEILRLTWDRILANQPITTVQALLMHEWAKIADRRKGHLFHRARIGLLSIDEKEELRAITYQLQIWDAYKKPIEI